MTREIKFRGKRVDTGEWVFGYFAYISDGTTEHKKIPVIFTGDTGYNLYEELVIKRFEVIPETVGQYTGLKDKNGKEIYERDILRLKCVLLNDLGQSNAYYRYEVIEWYQSPYNIGWRIRNGSLTMMIKPSALKTMKAEVFGNIHDNPELLKEIK
ncbi:hypothetical protein X792_04930 [Dehalococcoides mccartyi CG1]|jgi:uncharacterized phage protein (TIGR01671 family)|uniref:YopX family protein n=1 Tax=Dehalococcoides mccartyi TaxID=61435 RepID=UPI0004E09A3E|nr:YopX family protein [Dehalococcoides mccartyi]AII58082.1 hypothetical protein X792_04930 [Dehalococcoides mccartyi CG1]